MTDPSTASRSPSPFRGEQFSERGLIGAKRPSIIHYSSFISVATSLFIKARSAPWLLTTSFGIFYQMPFNSRSSPDAPKARALLLCQSRQSNQSALSVACSQHYSHRRAINGFRNHNTARLRTSTSHNPLTPSNNRQAYRKVLLILFPQSCTIW